MLNKKTKKLLKKLTYEEKDAIYRAVWFDNVKSDIRAHLAETDDTLTDKQIDQAAELYVYHGKYDCNLSYWSNIEEVINLVR